MSERIQTVLDEVSPAELGITLTHEHLAMNFDHFYRKPPKQLSDYIGKPLTLNNVGYLRQYPYSSYYNLDLNSAEAKKAVLADVTLFKKFGGGTIVENSTHGLDRDIEFCQRVSSETDVHVVVGTGYYIADMQDSHTIHFKQEELYRDMLKELTEGYMDAPNIKAGFIGEVASVWPIRDFERSAIRAAAAVQAEVGCGVSFHPHRHPDAPAEIIRIYAEAGGDVNKAVMSHLDRTLEGEKLLEFAELGTYCQFDLFGVEVSYYQLNVATDMPSDAQRLDMMKSLVDEGKQDKILMSHDIHTKHRLTQYGGHGYSHIINNVMPKMKTKGFTPALIGKITKDNPAAWLTIKKGK